MSNGRFCIGLSSKGLSNIPDHQKMRNFTFIIGNRRHLCLQFTASFVSPRIGRLLMFDCSMTEYDLGLSDPAAVSTHFFHFLAVLKLISEKNIAHFLFPFSKLLIIGSDVSY
jgi:hypothetical protein